MKKKYLFVIFLGMMTSPALAQDNMSRDGVEVMEEIVVTAGRSPEPAAEVSTAMTIIDREEIMASPSRDLGDLLAEKSVGYIQKYPGALTSVGIRGFRTDTHGNDLRAHVLVLLNGRRAGTGNLAKIMTGNIERVEIIRGPGAVQYGSAGMGGVINVITRQGKAPASARVFGGLGSYGYEEAGFLLSGKHAGLDFSSSYTYSTRDDYDTGDGETFHNTGYDDKESYSVNLGYTFLEYQRLGLILNRFESNGLGNPSTFELNDFDDYKNADNHSLDLIYSGGNPGSGMNWQIRYFDGKDSDTWYNPAGHDPQGYDDNSRSKSVTDQRGSQAQTTFNLSDLKLTTGLDWQDYEISTTWSPEETSYKNWAGFVLAKKKFLTDRLIVDAGLRYDDYEVKVMQPAGRSQEDNHITPAVGLSWQATKTLRFRARYGEGFVMPGADELAADYVTGWGQRYVGNSGLEPETSRTYEGGIEFRQNSLRAGLGYFYTRFTDKIEAVHLTSGDQTWENLGKAEISGFEGRISYDLGSLFSWPLEVSPYLNFVYLDRYRDLEEDQDLRYTNEANISYGLKVNTFQGFRARFNLAYSGPQTVIDYNTAPPYPDMEEAGFTVADLSLTKDLIELKGYGGFSLTAEVTNLFDKNYTYKSDYPMPGRSFFMTLDWSY